MNRAIVWLRRDLRLSDHRPLAEACDAAEEVLPVFVFDTRILDTLERRDDRRVTFIYRALEEVRSSLRQHGSDLLVCYGDPVQIIPQLAEDFGAAAVFTGRDYESYAITRDEAVASILQSQRTAFLRYTDQVVLDGADVLTKAVTPYKVFTPYSRAWRAQLDLQRETGRDPLRKWTADTSHLLRSTDGMFRQPWPTLADIGFTEGTLYLEAGEAAAELRLATFLKRIDTYKDNRDTPSSDATSHLSVDFRFGTLSVRAAFRAALSHSGPGAETWRTELIWREFYMMILDHFPHVEYSAFRPEYDRIVWPGSEEHFEAWCRGTTGYPIIDAAMRELHATGWMHNRLRMVTAMFLTKDLLVDWRLGEAWFAQWLLDFDLASNNGGWQWSASTGADSVPYFRIFNPVLQSKRFDKHGEYIRRWCPELKAFSDAHIHWPHAAPAAAQHAAHCVCGVDYPAPIVDHAVQKKRATALLAARLSTS